MLYGNVNPIPYRILSIDPGTDTLGISVFDVDFVHQTKTLIEAYTFKASRHIDDLLDNDYWQTQDEKYLRLHRHGQHLYELMCHLRPHHIVHENAFMGKYPKAYEGLVQCLYEIRLAARQYDPYIPLEGLAPMEAKSYIGGISKGQVESAVSKIEDLNNLQTILPTLDEHAIDSIAIGYTKACQLLEEYSTFFNNMPY